LVFPPKEVVTTDMPEVPNQTFFYLTRTVWKGYSVLATNGSKTTDGRVGAAFVDPSCNFSGIY